mmetsp:Transcript_21589/g.64886  ORF Transcript_21589/g.64886 Transcript_21589/m.64886 type:complete len:435 (-) Transcript_21589:85-1389(-)|eukprot:CAMPEP_0175231092 /NCGR_PEP_ID=MMETSP0093-20121207/25280_1 /TAXON_ID=311494 /ORGANISM="Alexandrium monilatum, Strain CCMP3105" /LENGTH=434 /DNA_ID=CAMNT_0016524937 /DNA_START=90 /DNA_END=1394 /DNA_ORIENTATION=-
MADFKDVSAKGDKSVLLKVVKKGADGPSPGDLAVCCAHYRFIKKTETGEKIKGGSKEVRQLIPKRTYKLPCILFDVEYSDMKFGNVENQSAEPKSFVCGEGEAPECVEFAVRRLGAGGSAVLQLKEGAMPEGRPRGELTVEVELVSWKEACRGPGDAGWAGMRSVVAERMAGEEFLSTAEEAAGRLEALYKLRAEWSVEEAIDDHVQEVKRTAMSAMRRFARAGKWIEAGQVKAEGVESEKVLALVGLAKAGLLQQKQFAPGAPAVKSLPLLSAKSMALKAVQLDPQNADAQAAAGSAYAELGDLAKAREYVAAALKFDPTHAAAKSELARINTKERGGALQDGKKAFLEKKEKLDAVFKKGDVGGIKDMLRQIKELIDQDTVAWDVFAKSKVGKTIGEIQKKPPKGDKEVEKAAADMVAQLVKFTDKKCRQVI